MSTPVAPAATLLAKRDALVAAVEGVRLAIGEIGWTKFQAAINEYGNACYENGVRAPRRPPADAGATFQFTHAGIPVEVTYDFQPARPSYNRDIPPDPARVDITGLWHAGEDISDLVGPVRLAEIVNDDLLSDIAEDEEAKNPWED